MRLTKFFFETRRVKDGQNPNRIKATTTLSEGGGSGGG